MDDLLMAIRRKAGLVVDEPEPADYDREARETVGRSGGHEDCEPPDWWPTDEELTLLDLRGEHN